MPSVPPSFQDSGVWTVVGASVANCVVVPGILSLMAQRCVRGFAARTCGLVGLVVVVTGCATSATLCWLGPSSFVTTLCDGCMYISNVANDFMMDCWRRCSLPFASAVISSLSSLCTASTCCIRLSVRRRQCYKSKSKDPEILWSPVLATKIFKLG